MTIRVLYPDSRSIPALYANQDPKATPGSWWRVRSKQQRILELCCSKDHVSTFDNPAVTRAGCTVHVLECGVKDCGFVGRLRLEDWSTLGWQRRRRHG